MGDEGLKALCAGIVEQAIKDYLLLLKTPNRMVLDGCSREGLEDWFRSDTFKLISNLDGDEIIKLCRRESVRNGRRKEFRKYCEKVPKG